MCLSLVTARNKFFPAGFETNAPEDAEAVTALSELTKNGLVAFKGTVKRTRDYRTVISLTDKETGKDVSGVRKHLKNKSLL